MEGGDISFSNSNQTRKFVDDVIDLIDLRPVAYYSIDSDILAIKFGENVSNIVEKLNASVCSILYFDTILIDKNNFYRCYGSKKE